MHPCPPRGPGGPRIFSEQIVGPEVRHYGDPRRIARPRWVALFYCITIHGRTGPPCTFRTFRTFRSARESEGKGGGGGEEGVQPGTRVHHERPEYYSRCTIYIVRCPPRRGSNEPVISVLRILRIARLMVIMSER